MRLFTNKSVIQKIIIAIIIVILCNFSIPTTVQADIGGILLSPVISLITIIFDQVYNLIEWAMLGETHFFIKESTSSEAQNAISGETAATIDISSLSDKELKFDGELWGIGSYGIPVLQYTPEEIFSNKVPALDINFINPSIKGGKEEKHIAAVIQPTIATWYVAIRAVSIVGQLSVLLYIGIRMMFTSIVADRAKYKQMLMDWIVAMCIGFTLHYIMSFALTMSETVTALLATDAGKTIHVLVPDGTEFNTNLMGYIRFMVQCTDLQQKITFLLLYIGLIIYLIRFTWIYLKRVVNMAFLTLIAPVVALTYPIDKVSDGKAQAFNMWIKEFTFNALLQPLHLLLYTVLLGSAVQLAVNNPLYAIVCLGMIISGEKLLKKMFGFEKASGGTLGSLAGAAGVTAVAGKALNSFAQKGGQGKGSNGKVRTKDIPERQGKDAGANGPFDAFDNKTADQTIGAGGGNVPLPPEDGTPKNQLTQAQQERRDELIAEGFTPEDPEWQQALGGDIGMPEADNVEPEEEDDNGENSDTGRENIPRREVQRISDTDRSGGIIDTLNNSLGSKEAMLATAKGLGQRAIGGVKKRAIGAWKAAPTALYKGARGTLQTASRVAVAGGLGALGLAIGATTGDGDKALSMALGAAGVGMATGDNLFDATLGKVMPDKSIRDAYGAGKYGNKIDARNARADKEYFKSQKFDDFYEKYYKGKENKVDGTAYTKKQIRDITQSYRSAGITSEKDIRKAIKLEEKYRTENPNLNEKDVREQVQNIVQSYQEIDIDKKAYTDDKIKGREIERIAGMLKGGANDSNKQVASQIFKGFEDWRNS